MSIQPSLAPAHISAPMISPVVSQATMSSNHINHELPIAAAENPLQVRQELSRSELLGATKDGKQIFLFDATPDSACMNELGRLREITYRQVGEGTGLARDIDPYDAYYRHIVLWDDSASEIVGAYRIGEAWQIANSHGVDALYSQSIFQFTPAFEPYLDSAIELGRSFIQPHYWGSRALDYLWRGIGAYLSKHPQVRWLFGPVSISDAFPETAKYQLVHFYRTWFGNDQATVVARTGWPMPTDVSAKLAERYPGQDYAGEFKQLRQSLAELGTAVPTLFKQYSDLCEAGGVQFLDFGIDKAFADSLDGFILIDRDKLLPGKRKRYLGE